MVFFSPQEFDDESDLGTGPFGMFLLELFEVVFVEHDVL